METNGQVAEVERILKARTHFHVLGFDVVESVEVSAVRRQYKNLARQVHPDKCSHANAEEAFKRLSIAYECLVDESMQYEYMTKISGSKKRQRPPPPQKHNKKAASSPPPRPKRQRTAEEIYAAFMEEEERQAEEEFKRRGFERNYESTPQNERVPSPPPLHTEEYIEALLASDLESKQSKWSQFTRPTNQLTPPAPKPQPTPSAQTNEACCLLCRRKFPTEVHLKRHEAESKLHAANLAKKM